MRMSSVTSRAGRARQLLPSDETIQQTGRRAAVAAATRDGNEGRFATFLALKEREQGK
jgi:hypothetical protein